jgi:hypothetical protein
LVYCYRGEAELRKVGAWRDEDVAAHPVRAGHVPHLDQLLVLPVVPLFLLIVVFLLLILLIEIPFLFLFTLLLPRVTETG